MQGRTTGWGAGGARAAGDIEGGPRIAEPTAPPHGEPTVDARPGAGRSERGGAGTTEDGEDRPQITLSRKWTVNGTHNM